jgi:hypothetical protein
MGGDGSGRDAHVLLHPVTFTNSHPAITRPAAITPFHSSPGSAPQPAARFDYACFAPPADDGLIRQASFFESWDVPGVKHVGRVDRIFPAWSPADSTNSACARYCSMSGRPAAPCCKDAVDFLPMKPSATHEIPAGEAGVSMNLAAMLAIRHQRSSEALP